MLDVRYFFNLLFSEYNRFSGNNYLWYLYPISIIIIVFLAPKKYKIFFGASSFLQIATIYNPILIQLLIEKIGFYNRYHRMFWMLLLYLTLSYAIFLVFESFEEKWKKIISLMLSIMVILFMGVFVWDAKSVSKRFTLPENSYITTDENIALYGYFHEEKKEPIVLADKTIYLTYRVFDPSVNMLCERPIYKMSSEYDAESVIAALNLSENMQTIVRVYYYDDYTIDHSAFVSAIKDFQVDYILSDEDELDTYLSECGAISKGTVNTNTIWVIK